MSTPVVLLNGPNLNMLGTREKEIYGSETLAEIETMCKDCAGGYGLTLECWQSNNESELITWIQQSANSYKGLIINAGAYSHTSIAIMDALKLCNMPIVEVHLSNIYRREEFRQHSYISRVADAVICGAGGLGYVLALQTISHLIKKRA